MEIHKIYIPPEILIYIFNYLNPSQQILLSNVNHYFRNIIKRYIKNIKIKFRSIIEPDNISLLKWCIDNGCNINEICDIIAYKGYINCLKYAHENKYQWNAGTCYNAAKGGHLNCLKYAHENGCEWDKDTCSSAAGNSLECLKYARENGCEWDSDTCMNAALNGHLECLNYAHENGCP